MNVDCLEWEGRIRRDGYGAFDIERREVLAHRAVYEAQYGPIPAGYEIHHECGNRACVNPHHLLMLQKGEHTVLTHTLDVCKRGHSQAVSRRRHPNGRIDCIECVAVRNSMRNPKL